MFDPLSQHSQNWSRNILNLRLCSLLEEQKGFPGGSFMTPILSTYYLLEILWSYWNAKIYLLVRDKIMASFEICFVLLDFEVGTYGRTDVRTDIQHVWKQWLLPAVILGRPSGSKCSFPSWKYLTWIHFYRNLTFIKQNLADLYNFVHCELSSRNRGTKIS